MTPLRTAAGLALAVSLLAGAPAAAGEAPAPNSAGTKPAPGAPPAIDAPVASDSAPRDDDARALETRLDTVEKQLALIQAKLRMLGAESEADVLGGELLADPRWLRDAALQQDASIEGVERAYRYFALIRQLHPESPEAREVFAPAARFHRLLFRAHRVRDLHSSWIVTEPIFMIHWLADFFEPGVFPEEEVNVLAWKLPMTFFETLEGYARTHPEMRRWKLEVEEDNGVIEKITGVPIDG